MANAVEVIVTGPRDMMPDLVSALVNDRLIAGGHLFPIDSTYRWQGAVRNAEETRATMHTTRARLDTLIERIRREHPYQVPCIVVTSFTAGAPDYIAWIKAQTDTGAGAE